MRGGRNPSPEKPRVSLPRVLVSEQETNVYSPKIFTALKGRGKERRGRGKLGRIGR